MRFTWPLLALTLSSGASARADERDSGPTKASGPRPLALAAGGAALVDTSSSCRRDQDEVGCSVASFRGAYVAARVRPATIFSAGFFASWGSSPERDQASYSAWQLLAETRLHLLGVAPIDPFAGTLVGVATATDTLAADSSTSVTRYAPSAGLAAGVDFRLLPPLSLELATRGFVAAFPDPEPLGGAESRDYGTSAWLELSLGLVVHPLPPSRARSTARVR